MEVIEQIVTDKMEIFEDGQMQVRVATRLFKLDGTLISETYHRTTLEPGQDIGKEAQTVKNVAAVVWTPEVKAAYAEKKAKIMADMEKTIKGEK